MSQVTAFVDLILFIFGKCLRLPILNIHEFVHNVKVAGAGETSAWFTNMVPLP